MSKQLYIQTFNNKMDEFFKDLINVFPNDKDLKLAKSAFNLSKLNNVELPCKIFYKAIYNYKDNILKKNENFFLENDYNDLVIDDIDITSQLIQKIKDNWKSLNNKDKECVWTYLILLYRLADKCYN